MTRLLCLGCHEAGGSSTDGKTTDYCAFCLFEELQLDCAVETERQSVWHPFLQIRRFTFNKWGHFVAEEAGSVAQQKAADFVKYNHPKCHVCRRTVTRLPIWYCLECTGAVRLLPQALVLQKADILCSLQRKPTYAKTATSRTKNKSIC